MKWAVPVTLNRNSIPPAAVSKSSRDIPKSFVLSGAYPNPFNPSTRIDFDIPFECGRDGIPVRLEIYDSRGMKVRSLLQDRYGPGRYSIQWNGQADNGRAATSGYYLCKMMAGTFMMSQGMLLMR